MKVVANTGTRYIRVHSRDLKDLPDNLQAGIDEVTINENPRLVGSIAFLEHKYPSDVDIFERVYCPGTLDQAVEYYTGHFKSIMEKILVDNRLHFSDFKTGIDDRFDFDLATTTSSERIQMAKELLRDGLITKQEYTSANPSSLEDFTEFMRLHKVLRWTPDEVLHGYKPLPGDRTIKFSDAIIQPTLVKLDVIIWSMGRYVTIEVLYDLYYQRDGNYVELYPLGNYVSNLINDIHFYSRPNNYNPLKVAKRLWSLSLVTGCTDFIAALNPLLRSDVAALNQVNVDIETLLLLMANSHLRAEDRKNITLELLGFRKRLSNHLDLNTYLQLNLDFADSEPRTLELELEDLSDFLTQEVIARSQKFFEHLARLNLTCDNPQFKQKVLVGIEWRPINK